MNRKKYVDDFGILHTSTFAEDDFSSAIALEVLNVLQGDNSPVEEGLKNATYLWARLNSLRTRFPDIVREIRGKGMMLAIEFTDKLSEMGFEFKTICDSRMQGYMIASALLNHENIRMSPSLSNNLTLRVQPSLYFSRVHVEELMTGLTHMCKALREKQIAYFLSCMYPTQTVNNIQTPPLTTHIEKGKRPLAVFLCHLIDEVHVKKITKALRNVDNKTLMHKLSLMKDLADFEIYHAQTIVDNNAKEMDIVMLGVPISSEELKSTFTSRQRFKVVQKVQRAVNYAKELGASTVGLGQFTSIVSGNGLYLNSRGMNLTTGNAYTVSLAVQSALRSAEEKNVHVRSACVSLIGAAGNIMSVASSLMADHVGKVILVHHTVIDASSKYQQATRKILDDVAASAADSKVCETVRRLWKKQNLLEFLSIDEVKDTFVTTADITRIKESEIVLCGASASNGFLALDLFKENAVAVDVGVPPSIEPELLEELKSE